MALGDRVASQEKSVEEHVEQSSEMLAWLHRGIGLMNLQQKEKYGKISGPLWSSVLMGFLRNNDALDPAEDAPARLANCDDLHARGRAAALRKSLFRIVRTCRQRHDTCQQQNLFHHIHSQL